MKYTLTLLLYLICSTILWSNNYYFFQKITKDSDFTFGSVNTLCEDANGFIWFGCGNGLYYHNTIKVERAKLFADKEDNSQSILINKIYKDNNNDLWICSEKGLFKHIKTTNNFELKTLYIHKNKEPGNIIINNIIQFKHKTYLIHVNSSVYMYHENDSILSPIKANIKGDISYLHKDESGIIYFGTINGNVYISKDNLKHTNQLYRSKKNNVSTICKDGSKYYIGYSRGGIDIINLKGIKIAELSSKLKGNSYLKNDRIRQILKRKNGEIWIATHIGIIILYQGQQTVLDSRSEIGLPHRTVFSMHIGRNENIWVGTFAGGVAYYSDYNYSFKHVPIDYDRKLSIRSTVSSFCEDKRGYIWIGSEDEGGIKIFDPKTDDFVQELEKEFEENTKDIKSITCIDNDIIAIGRLFNNQLLLYNYKKRKSEQLIDMPMKPTTGVLCANFFDNKLWISSRRKLFSYDIQTKEIKKIFELDSEVKDRIWYLYFDSSHNLWICTDGGLFVKNKGSDKIYKCFSATSPFDFSQESIYSVCEDNDGLLWVGTKGKGIYMYIPENQSTRLPPDHELSDDADIYSLIKDKQGNIWYNTNQGLYRYDASNNSTDHYGTIDGLPSAKIGPNSAFCSQSGLLYFGSINGFSVIDPNIVKENLNAPSVHITGISINNKPLSKDNIISINSLNLLEAKTIKLSSEQNTLGFKVVSNNFIKPEKNRFKYRLINYDDNWVEVSQNRNISFTKVPSGKYIFEVFGSNNDNVWSDKPYQLEITILAPYYRRWYALLLYIIIFVVATYLIYKELETKIMLRKEITEERFKSQRNDLIYSERVKFFTNISHEIRTPLSLIISPVKSLLEKNDYDINTKNRLKVVDRNAKRLLKIIDQSLDFRLLEVGKLEPNFERYEIIELATDVYLCFEQQIIDRQINFSFTSEFQKLETIIDGDMIEKIIYNLLSNALKYTPEKGHIFLSISKKYLTENDYKNYICSGKKFTGKAIEIIIRDTGKGIKSELLPHIFERFAKGNESHKTSSGIGLHICKEYSEMNDGNILLTSNEGIGSTFILNLPLKDDAKYESNKHKQIIKHDFTGNDIIPKLETTGNSYKHTILITEDNDELRNYLKKFLANYFKVITTKSGEEALDLLENLTPDVMITDVSMPGISGIELTKKLKEDPSKQHIAIIVMTAHTERKYQMESILGGADAFLTKPIEESMILAQINNILKKQTPQKNKSTQKEVLIDQDNFIKRVEKIIESNFHNDQFSITDILNTLGISKSTLDRRIKAETQLNPSAFIRDVRIKNAVKLMRTNKFNIDEIATYVGFNSTSYFIRTFKSKYGVTPKEYRKENKE